MGAFERFKQIAQIIGLLVILASVVAVGAIVYLWWESREAPAQPGIDPQSDEPDTVNDTA